MLCACLGDSADALTWLPAVTQPAEAAKVHSNRALSFLKLASAARNAAARPAPAPAPAPATGAGTCTDAGTKGSAAAAENRQCALVQELAAAAADDCTAALVCCEQELIHKVRMPTLVDAAVAQRTQHQHCA